MNLLNRLKAEYSNFISAPKWRRYLWLFLALFGMAYLAWCKWGPQPVKPGSVMAGKTSPRVADLERKTLEPKKLIVFKDKARAVSRLNLPSSEAAEPREEMLESTDAPPSRYGTTTTTFINMSTGMPRSVIQANKAPLFRFERGMELGAEVGMGAKGRYVQGDIQRDVFSVKGVIVGGKAAVTSYPTETDWRVGVRAKYQW